MLNPGQAASLPPGTEIRVVTVASPGASDATIILPGATEPTQKRYKYAVQGMRVSEGDLVYAIKISGTYVLLGGRITGEGEPGATFTPSVSEAGVISWKNDAGLPNPQPVNIRGPQGIQGPKGDTGDTGPQGPRGNGMYAFEIRADGHLWCVYDTAEPPAFSINAAGHLIYTIGV